MQYSEGTKAALKKRIPEQILYRGSRECLLGVLAGLLDGDGSVGWNRVLKNPRARIGLSTSSRRLVEDIRVLGTRLGFGISVTTMPPRGWSNTAYTVNFSIGDMWEIFPELEFVGEKERAFREEFIAIEQPAQPMDFVPVLKSEAEAAQQYLPAKRNTERTLATMRGEWSRAKKGGSLLRTTAIKYLSYLPKDFCPELRKHVANTNVSWEKYEKVTPVESRDVFDIGVCPTKVFAIANGLIIFDTMNISVPFSEDAIKEAYEILLPSKSLTKSSDMKSAMHKIISENAGGLYLASLPPDKKKQTRTFVSWADAKRAYQNGELAIDEPVTVLSEKPLPKNK
jgi:hypothetical protein